MTEGFLSASPYSESVVRALLDGLFSETENIHLAAMRADLVAGINRLPELERKVLVYGAMGYSQREIARRLRLSLGGTNHLAQFAFLLLYITLNPQLLGEIKTALEVEGEAA